MKIDANLKLNIKDQLETMLGTNPPHIADDSVDILRKVYHRMVLLIGVLFCIIIMWVTVEITVQKQHTNPIPIRSTSQELLDNIIFSNTSSNLNTPDQQHREEERFDLTNYSLTKQSFDRLVMDKYSKTHIPMRVVEIYYDAIGPAEMLNALEYSSTGQRRFCHVLAHNLGKVIFKRSNSLLEAAGVCGSNCTTGCFHGVLMQQLYNVTQFDEVSKTKAHALSPAESLSLQSLYFELCGNGNTELTMVALHRYGALACYHGLGHAVLSSVADYDIHRAMNECKNMEDKSRLANTSAYPLSHFTEAFKAFECATGAYMEWESSAPRHLKENVSALFPCDSSDDFPAACYRYPLDRLHFVSMGPEKVGRMCANMSDPFHRWGCMHGFGQRFTSYFVFPFGKNATLSLEELCAYGDLTDRNMCVDGASWFMGNRHVEKRIICSRMKNKVLQQTCTVTNSELMYFFRFPERYYATREMKESNIRPWSAYNRPANWTNVRESLIWDLVYPQQ